MYVSNALKSVRPHSVAPLESHKSDFSEDPSTDRWQFLTLKHLAAPKTVATATLLLPSVQSTLTVSTISNAPLSDKLGTNRYFCEVRISSLKEDSIAEEILPRQAALTDTGLGLSVAFAARETRMNSKIRIKSLRESPEFPWNGIVKTTALVEVMNLPLDQITQFTPVPRILIPLHFSSVTE